MGSPLVGQEALGVQGHALHFRTIGSLTGSFFLRILKTRWFFIISVVLMAAAMLLMHYAKHKRYRCQEASWQSS